MGLTRDDLKPIARLVDKSLEDCTFVPFPEKPTNSNSNTPKTKTLPGKPAIIKQEKAKVQQQDEPKRSPKLKKPSQLMPLHVPGPKALHKNILIRAYTSEMDETQPDGGSSVPRTATTPLPPGEKEEAAITIESFVPFYSVTR
jgi:hypothetical protein